MPLLSRPPPPPPNPRSAPSSKDACKTNTFPKKDEGPSSSDERAPEWTTTPHGKALDFRSELQRKLQQRRPSSPGAAGGCSGQAEEMTVEEPSEPEALEAPSNFPSSGSTASPAIAETVTTTPQLLQRSTPSGLSSGRSTPRSGLYSFSDSSPKLPIPAIRATDGLQLHLTSSGASTIASFDEDQKATYTTWRRRNLEGELNLTRGELQEARLHSARLEQELQAMQRENAELKRRLEIQQDRDDLLRDIRDRVSEVSSHRGSLISSNVEQSGGRLCRKVCSILGR